MLVARRRGQASYKPKRELPLASGSYSVFQFLTRLEAKTEKGSLGIVLMNPRPVDSTFEGCKLKN